MPHPLPANQQRTLFDSIAPRHYLAAAFAFYLLMVLIGSLPGKADAMSAASSDKFLHFCAYAFIAALLYRGLRGRPASRATLAVALGAFLGGLDEAIQLLFPYRHADWNDWHVDVIAAACAVGLSLAATAFTAMRMQPKAAKPQHAAIRPLRSVNGRADEL